MSKKHLYGICIFIGALLTTVAFQNCGPNGASVDFRAKMGTQNDNSSIFGQGLPEDDDNPTNVVCDPFATTDTTVPGLKAHLYAYEGPKPSDNIKKLEDIFQKGKRVEDTVIYFSKVHVPTRRFELGFENKSGDKLMNSKDEVLIEWFGLKFETLLKLDAAEADGMYQLATISDDGSVVEVDSGSGYQRIVDNDGTTATRFRCGAVINIKKGDLLPARVAYFQGPRVEIALNMLWRKVDSKTKLKSKHCDTTNDFFSGGGPGWKMKDLENDGWKIMKTSNFELKEKTTVSCPTK